MKEKEEELKETLENEAEASGRIEAARLSREAADLAKIGKYREASKCYSTALEFDPKNIDAHIGKAEALYKIGQRRKAEMCFEAALCLDPSNTNTLSKKGAFHVDEVSGSAHSRNFRAAKKCFDKAISLNPKDAELWRLKAKLFKNAGKGEDTIKYYDKALMINPKDVNLMNEKGMALYYPAIMDFEGALKCFEEVIKISPANSKAHEFRIRSLMNLQKYEDMMAATKDAIKAGAIGVKTIKWLASALNYRKRPNEVAKMYDAEAHIEPSLSKKKPLDDIIIKNDGV